MKASKFVAWLMFALLFSVGSARTSHANPEESLTVAGMFGNGMVLQQQTAAAIWGQAKPDAKVKVRASWGTKVSVATADAEGKWKTTIDTPKAGGPFKLSVESGSERKEFKDVLCGEVWICSGQSNMQWKMRGFGVDHWKEDVKQANRPNIRLCQIPQTLALEPQADLKASWSRCTPNKVLNFSAVAYFFGSRLQEELGVPIGLVSTNWGGSSAEAWINPDVLGKEFPEFNKVSDRYEGLIQEHGAVYTNRQKPKGINQRMPSILYNKMIKPVIPFSIRGVIWYQGESNVKNPLQYRKLFPSLIKSWRQEWGQGDFPFYFVQIAPFGYKTELLPVALLREAQLQALEVPNTGMVVTMDIGNPENIHPKKKKPVAERLARLALAKDYGRTDLSFSGPMLVEQQVKGKQIRLRFEHVGEGLISRDGKPLSHFTVAGKDRNFHPATAEIDGDTLIVSSPKVARPVAVRFAWGNADEPNLSNKEGFPCSSFRTDDWEIAPKKPARRKRPKKSN